MNQGPDFISTEDQPPPEEVEESELQESITTFVGRLNAVLKPLRDDCDALQAADQSDQRARRVYVRAVFAEIEATLDMYAQFILLFHRDQLRPEELLILDEQEAAIDDSGSVKLRKLKCSLKSRLRFVFRTAQEYNGLYPPPNYQDNRWSDLQKSIMVRDRLTHPKLSGEIEVSNQELDALSRGRAWFEEISVQP